MACTASYSPTYSENVVQCRSTIADTRCWVAQRRRGYSSSFASHFVLSDSQRLFSNSDCTLLLTRPLAGFRQISFVSSIRRGSISRLGFRSHSSALFLASAALSIDLRPLSHSPHILRYINRVRNTGQRVPNAISVSERAEWRVSLHDRIPAGRALARKGLL